MILRLASNSPSSCLNLLRAAITVMHYHTWLNYFLKAITTFWVLKKFLPIQGHEGIFVFEIGSYRYLCPGWS
jgi:hypothetical protein